jgi:hypothetical protein
MELTGPRQPRSPKPRTLTLPVASPRAALLQRLQRLPPLHPPLPPTATLTEDLIGTEDVAWVRCGRTCRAGRAWWCGRA